MCDKNKKQMRTLYEIPDPLDTETFKVFLNENKLNRVSENFNDYISSDRYIKIKIEFKQ